MLWNETTHDDPITERAAQTGGSNSQALNPQLMHEIQVAVSRLVCKAAQLIHNFTTNLAESWMHIRCKFDGGKVVNRSQSGSWEHTLLWCRSRAKPRKRMGSTSVAKVSRVIAQSGFLRHSNILCKKSCKGSKTQSSRPLQRKQTS